MPCRIHVEQRLICFVFSLVFAFPFCPLHVSTRYIGMGNHLWRDLEENWKHHWFMIVTWWNGFRGKGACVFLCWFLAKINPNGSGWFPSSTVKFRDGCIMRYRWLISTELSQTSTGEWKWWWFKIVCYPSPFGKKIVDHHLEIKGKKFKKMMLWKQAFPAKLWIRQRFLKGSLCHFATESL